MFHLGKQWGRTCHYKPWTRDTRGKTEQPRTACQTPKASKTKHLGTNPRFKQVWSHWLNTTSSCLHPILMIQLFIACTRHTAPGSPEAAPVVPGLGLWEKCEPELWQRSPSAQDKLQCKMQWNWRFKSPWRMYSLFSQLLFILTLGPHQHVWCFQRYENFIILEDWSSSNIHTSEPAH